MQNVVALETGLGHGGGVMNAITMKGNVIARRYSVGMSGQDCLELLRTRRGYLVARNGRVEDTRRRLSSPEAREWYDRAAYQVGPRP